MVLENEINNRFAGMRLDAYLTEKYTYHSRNQWQKKIDEGVVLLNNKKVKASTKIVRDSILTY
ncbi:MAG: RluA family pseudouridine synthase, partial [Fibrobacteres bacterium]|nr:RluA family pseudouridine synthase [Fibrobacterota bacterium]